jgi:hypothetical protein
LPHGGNAHQLQSVVTLIVVHVRKVTKNLPKRQKRTRRETFYQAPRLYR